MTESTLKKSGYGWLTVVNIFLRGEAGEGTSTLLSCRKQTQCFLTVGTDLNEANCNFKKSLMSY